MVGGLGNDYYVVDSVADKVDENTIVDGLFVQGRSDGFDSVFSSVTYTLPPEVEYLRLTGDADINGTGNDLQNRIYGNNGINILNGGGGSGDYLAGRGGDDVYEVENNTVSVVEESGNGNDTIRATSATSGHTFALPANVENLELLGLTDINGQGNNGANKLTGNDGHNTLSGMSRNDTVDGNDTLIGGAGNDTLDGGFGADSMLGGLGNDTYFVENLGDKVIEAADAGNDSVISSIDWTLSGEQGDNVENLILADGAIIGTGNALANRLTGNSANNTLNGGGGSSGDTFDGGAGADTMNGGTGNDVFDGGAGADIMNGGQGNCIK